MPVQCINGKNYARGSLVISIFIVCNPWRPKKIEMVYQNNFVERNVTEEYTLSVNLKINPNSIT